MKKLFFYKSVVSLVCVVLALAFVGVGYVQAVPINIGNWSGSYRSWNQSDFATIKNTMINAGHTVEEDAPISAAALANDNLFIVGEALSTPNTGELSALSSWVNSGGILLVFTNSSFSGGSGGNGILSGIGSTMSFTSASANATGPFQGGNFASEGPPYNLVGQSIGVSPGNIVNGGNVLYGFGIHYEAIGSGFVFAFGDRYDHNFFSPTNLNNNGRLFLNIAEGAGAAGKAIISPGSSTLVTTQVFDVVFIIDTFGDPITGVSIFLNGVDITAAVLGIPPVIGSTPAGQLTGRLPGIGAALLGPGSHTLSIVVTTPAGTFGDTVTYEVIPNTEP